MSVIKNKAKLLQLNSSVIEFIPKTFKACTFKNSHHYSHHYGSRQCTSHKQTLFHLFFIISWRERIYKIIFKLSCKHFLLLRIAVLCLVITNSWPDADHLCGDLMTTRSDVGISPRPTYAANLGVTMTPSGTASRQTTCSYRGQTGPSIFYQLK